MKTLAYTVSALAGLASAEEAIRIMAATKQPIMMQADQPSMTSVLHSPTAVLNKNNVLVDSNVGIAKSSVMQTQNDDIIIRDNKGDFQLRGTAETPKEETSDGHDDEQFWNFGYPRYQYRYVYRYGW